MSTAITKRQTTFWDIVVPSGKTRVHFHGKEEFCFQESEVEAISILEKHPLLLNYQLPWLDLYISSSAKRPRGLIERICLEWTKLLNGWRSPLSYMTETGPERMLLEGYGQLLSAPDVLVFSAEKILKRHGVRFTVLRGRSAQTAKKVMLAGSSYVIADEFHIEQKTT